MARILITGSAGFIGNHLSNKAIARGDEVIAIYRNRRPTGLTKQFAETVRRDLVDGISDLPPVDFVIHAAADTHLNHDLTTADYVNSNVLGTSELIRYVRRCRPEPPVLFLSTNTVYGDVLVPKIDESSPCTNPNLYGLTKLLAESMFDDHAEHLRVMCLRLPGVVGPGYRTPWIGKVLSACLRGEPVRIYNPRSPFNNVTDVHDLDRLVVHLMQRGVPVGTDVVNMATTDPVTVEQAVQTLIRELASQSEIEVLPADRPSFWIGTEKIDAHYGFKPACTIDVVRQFACENAQQLTSAA